MADRVRSTTNKVTDLAQVRRESRSRRYHLQEVAGRLLPDWRVSWCLHRPSHVPGKEQGVSVWLDPGEGKAHFRGLATCGSVWVCPVCASRISEGRRLELEQAVSRSGLTPVLVTVTLQHSRSDRLEDIVEDLNAGLRRLKMGGWWTRFQASYSVKAHVSSLEMTWGSENGWHPHKHWLLFLDLPEDQVNADQLKNALTGRWKSIMSKNGHYVSYQHGIDVQVGNNAAGAYTAKWGLASEVCKAVVKDSRSGLSPWQLLDLAGQGDLQAGALFCEYALATQGKRQLVWSKGGRQVLGLGQEVEDEVLAAEEVIQDQSSAVCLVRLDSTEWGMILKAGARVRILELAEGGGVAAVQAFLDELWTKYRKKREGEVWQ